MKNMTIKSLVGVGLATLCSASSAFAFSDPPTATTTNSVGSTDISVEVPVLYRISGLANLAHGTYDGAGAETISEDVCIYTNVSGAPAGTYRISVVGSSTCSGGACTPTPATTFAISNDALDASIEYRVYWNDETGLTNRAAVGAKGATSLQTTANQSGANQVSSNCAGGSNANISVDFIEADLLAVPNGVYDGTLTITLVAPT